MAKSTGIIVAIVIVAVVLMIVLAGGWWKADSKESVCGGRAGNPVNSVGEPVYCPGCRVHPYLNKGPCSHWHGQYKSHWNGCGAADGVSADDIARASVPLRRDPGVCALLTGCNYPIERMANAPRGELRFDINDNVLSQVAAGF